MKKKTYKLFVAACCIPCILTACGSITEINKTENTEAVTETVTGVESENTRIVIGNEKTGTIMPGEGYEISDFSELMHRDAYFIAANENTGIAMVLAEEDMDDMLAINHNNDGYTAEDIREVDTGNENYPAKMYFASMEEEDAHYCTVCIRDMNENKTIIVTITTLSPVPIEEFRGNCYEILKTHSFGLFENIGK